MSKRWVFGSVSALFLVLSVRAAFALQAPIAPVVRVDELTINDAPPPSMYAGYLRTAIDAQIPAIRECYRTRLAQRPELQGSMRFRLWVSARQVIRTTPETLVGDAQLEECTRAQIRRFTLPPQVPEGGVSVKFVVTFTPPMRGTTTPDTSAPVDDAVRTRVPPRCEVSSVGFARPSTSLSTRLSTAAFQNCANILCQGGTVVMNVTTDRRGRLRASAVARVSTVGRDLRSCVVAAAQATQATQAAQGASAAERNVVTVLISTTQSRSIAQ